MEIQVWVEVIREHMRDNFPVMRTLPGRRYMESMCQLFIHRRPRAERGLGEKKSILSKETIWAKSKRSNTTWPEAARAGG